MKKLLIILLSILFIHGIGNALFYIKLPFSNPFRDRLHQVHFTQDNEFMGYVLLLNYEAINNTKKIKLGTKDRDCNKQLRGFYFNPMRGNNVYPIDEKTFNAWKNINNTNNNVFINYFTGGLYTECNENPHSIHGQIKYKYNNITEDDYFTLTAGFGKYSNIHNINLTKFQHNFQVENHTNGNLPIGLIYDSTYGAGFVGGKVNGDIEEFITYDFTGNKSINSEISSFTGGNITFTGLPTIIRNNSSISQTRLENILGISGIFSRGIQYDDDLDGIEEQAVTNLSTTQTYQVGDKGLGIGDVYNLLRKNSEKLCRGKRKNFNNTDDIKKGKINCFNENKKVEIDKDITASERTVIIVKDKDLKIGASQEGGILDVFVNGGNIVLENGTGLVGINGNGYLASSGDEVTKGLFLKGNYMTNGLIIGDNSDHTYEHKVYVDGGVVTLNSIDGVSEGRKSMVERAVGDTLQNNILFANTLKWRCDINNSGNLEGTDGEACDHVDDKWRSNTFIVQGGLDSIMLVE